MAVFLSEVDKGVQEELRTRVRFNNYLNSGTDRTYIDWHKKTPWIKLFSNVVTVDRNKLFSDDSSLITNESCNDSTLAEENVLVGSTLLDGKKEIRRSGFKELYTNLDTNNNDNNIPFRPYPIIESVKIKTVGKLGSLRKANINFKCFTLEQLGNLEILYMTPGASCVLQWGWSNQMTDTSEFKMAERLNEKTTPYKNENIEEKRKMANYSMDAMVGIVTDFEYTFDDNGSFNCNIELTARGFEGLFMDKETATANIVFEDQKGSVKITMSAFADRFEEYLKMDRIKKYILYNKWMSIGFIEDMIISKFTKKDGIGEFKSYQRIEVKDSAHKLKVPEYCGNHPKLLSMDSDVFILPVKNMHNDRRNVNGMEIPAVTDSTIDVEKVFNVKGNSGSGYIRNILVHKKTVLKHLKSSTSTMDFIERILNDINEYSLNYLNLKVIIDSDTNTAKIIDFDSSIDDVRTILNGNLSLEFKVLEKGSIVRGVSLGSQLPDKIKSAALYSINGLSSDVNGNALGRMFAGVSDSYLKYLKDTNTDADQVQNEKSKEYTITTDTKLEAALARREYILQMGYRLYNYSIKKIYWNSLRNNLLDIRNGNQENNQLINNRMIPITLELTLDGISGITYGNAITVDYLLSRYRRNCLFQVTYITDTIDSIGWVTTLNSQLRVGLNEGKLDLYGTIVSDLEKINSVGMEAESTGVKFNPLPLP